MLDSHILNMRFSTAMYADADRIEAWREYFGRAICELDIEPLAGREFQSSAVLRMLPGLGMASGSCSGAHYWRPRRLLRNDDLLFVVNHTGTDHADMLGRQTVVGPGEAVLLTAGEVGGVTNKGGTRFTTFRIQREMLAPALSNVEMAMVNPIPANNKALQLLLNYISVLEDTAALTDPDVCNRVVSHVYDLMALALGATRDAAALARRRGLAAARLRAIKGDIVRYAGASSLSVGRVAARYGVTARYVQMLFEREETTFSEFVLVQRLAAAHRKLRDETSLKRTISSIALETGFSDVSYFNRVFRRHFNATPSDVRARAAALR